MGFRKRAANYVELLYSLVVTVYHCTFRGTLLANTIGEIFSHSLGIESASDESTVADALRSGWETLWGTGALGIGTMFYSGIEYTEVTVARVIDPMVPDLGAAVHLPFSPPLPGRGGNASLPSQCALAISLNAGFKPNGSPFKGRFYLPPPHMNTTYVDGVLPNQTTEALAIAFETFFNDLFIAGHWPSVWSRTHEDLVGTVTHVRVGNKIDTIRTRRNGFPETYSMKALVGPQ